MNAELLKQLDRIADFVNEASAVAREDGWRELYKQGLDALGDIDNMRAALAQPADEDAWLSGVIKQIAELPDRNSPEGQPEMMLVTAEELTSILRARPAKESFESVKEPTDRSGLCR